MYKKASVTVQEAVAEGIPVSQQAQWRAYFSTFNSKVGASVGEVPLAWPLRKKILIAKISQQEKPIILVGLLDSQQLNTVWTKQRFLTEFGTAQVADVSSSRYERSLMSMSKFVTTMQEEKGAW